MPIHNIKHGMLELQTKADLISVCKTWGISYQGTKTQIIKRMDEHMTECETHAD